MLALIAPFNPWIVGSGKRLQIEKESGGTFLGQMELVAMMLIPARNAGRVKQLTIAVSWFGVLVLFGLVGFLGMSVDDLLSTRPINWPHATTIVVEYLFNFSPLTLFMTGSAFILYEIACLVLAISILTSLVKLNSRRLGNG
jgi:hypothetical protein